MSQESIIPKIRQETRTVRMTFELKKDLGENEEICEHCHGTGLEIDDNVYGIRGDITHIGTRFPYKHQSLSFCKYCYNGVLRKCPECGALLNKQTYECACGYHERKRNAEQEKEDLKTWEKSEKISLEDAFKKFGCLYIDNLDKYVFDEDEIETVIEECLYEEYGIDISSLRIYGTKEVKISIDADDIAANACDDLHEDAYDKCDTKGLQKVLDEWCKKQSGATTYYPDYKVGVIVETIQEGEDTTCREDTN